MRGQLLKLGLLLGLSMPGWAMAQPGIDRPDESKVLTMGLEAGAGRIDDDIFLQTTLSVIAQLQLPGLLCEPGESACKQLFYVMLQAPLRVRLVDRAPEQGALLREEDWDELNDIGRLVGLIQYGEVDSPLVLRFGKTGLATLGEESVLHHYINELNPDHGKLGAWMRLQLPALSVSMMADSVLSPTLGGVAVSFRPFRLRSPYKRRFADRFELTSQLVMDFAAPTQLALQDDIVVVDDTRRPEVASTQTTEIVGAGIGVWPSYDYFLTTRLGAEFNAHPDVGGWGTHLNGTLLTHFFDLFTLHLKLEYVLAQGGYIPRYFGPRYDVERYQVQGWGAELPAPKLRLAANLPDARAHYLLNSFSLFIPDLMSALSLHHERSYTLSHGDTFGASLSLHPHTMLDVWLFYWRPNINKRDYFGLDRSIIDAEVRLKPLQWLYVVGRHNRRWRLGEDGSFATIPDWFVGVGAQTAFAFD